MSINRRKFLGGVTAGLVGGVLAVNNKSEARENSRASDFQSGSNARRPNILHIMVDQMQAAAIANRSPANTPNINRLAAQGINFNRAYTPSAICCPARAMLATGAYHWHNGVFNQVHSAPSVSRDMFPNVITYSQRLKEAGYRQGYLGKWHASFLRTPLDFGYDEIAAPHAYNQRLIKKINTNPDNVPEHSEDDFKKTVLRYVQWAGEQKPFAQWGYVEGNEENSESNFLAESTVRMMRRYAKGTQPWHIEAHFTEPHDPYFPLKKYFDRYDPSKIPVPASFRDTFVGKPGMHRRESEIWGNMTEKDYQQSRACYYAYCEQVDASVGKILDALEETGQADDTIVTFTTDHGDLCGAHRMWIKGWMPYEECYRIPLVMRWRNRIKPNQTSDKLVQLHDLAYSYIEAAEAKPLGYEEGRSLLPLAAEPNLKSWTDQILCAYYGGEFLYTQRIVITDRFKYVFNGFDYDELYDLKKDSQEIKNVVGDRRYAQIADDMRARMYELMNKLGDPFGDVGPRLPDGNPPGRYCAARYLPRGKRLTQPFAD